MGNVIKLKFKDPMPANLETHLRNRGFRLSGILIGHYVTFERETKYVPWVPPKQDTLPAILPTPDDVITPTQQVMLGRRCKEIRDTFYNPKAQAALIRFRIGEMARPFNKAEKAWMEDWVERNVDAL